MYQHQYLSSALNCGVKLQCFSLALELSMNGELDSLRYGGFKRIVIHFETNKSVDVKIDGITVKDGHDVKFYTGNDHITVGR